MDIVGSTAVIGNGNHGSLISKSAFLSGIQCKKLFWTKYHESHLIPPPDQQTLATFEQGRDVGLLARQLFPDGIEVGAGTLDLNRLLKLHRPLYEAAFIFNGCFARLDILTPTDNDAWDIVEVKSTTTVKDIHLTDLAFQTHVAKGSGLAVRRCLLCHVNPNYIRHGAVDPKQLFILEDVTDRVMALADGVKKSITELVEVLHSDDCSDVQIGPHCDDPHPCPLHDHCWSFLPEQNVTTLYRGMRKGLKLLGNGTAHIKDIPSDFPLSAKQAIQYRAVTSGKLHIERTAVSKFLRRLKYPISFLDFETLGTAIPLFDDVRPYQQIPFEFSLHVVGSPGHEPVHHSFLADGMDDPRRQFMQRLQNVLPPTGSVVAYNANFEISRLNECAAVIPGLDGWVKNVEKRTVDLLQPFRRFHFYHPD